MYKLTIITILAIGFMAFNQPEKGKSNHSDKNTNIKTSIHVKKGSGVKDISSDFDQKEKGNKDKNKNNSHKKNHQNSDKKQKENNNAIKHVNKKHENGKHENGKHDNDNHGKNNKKHYKKGHPNFNYVYVNKHGYFSHKNYGQWRSQQAKNKHKHYHPVYEYQAIEGYRLINSLNVFLYDETDYKINLLNTRLAEKREENLINAIQYDAYVRQINLLQERHSGLNINISL